MRKPYSSLARVYDQLMEFDYRGLADFYETVFRRYSVYPKTLLDLACGTGRLTVLLSARGYDMVGTDASAEMLSAAWTNIGTDSNVLLLCQTMQELDLNDTVDGVICALDGINHLPTLEQVQKVFQKVSLFTNRGGLFIFDIHSLTKMQKTLGQNTFVYDNPECYCVWQNHWVSASRRIDYALQIFLKNGSVYHRIEDTFSEYYYSPQQLSEILVQTGFRVLLVTAGQSLEPYTQQSCDRHFIIAQRI